VHLRTPLYDQGTREGQGLGVASVKAMVDKLEGAFQVQSSPGVGTTFQIQIQLPLTISREAPKPTSSWVSGPVNPASGPSEDAWR
jgi:K+-sensing histidine kinase KdpD